MLLTFIHINILIAAGNIPTRKANISLKLIMDFLPEYGNVNSPQYKNLTSILKREVSIVPFFKKKLCMF